MEPKLLLRPGLLALLGPRIEAERHAHSALQIVWPVAGASWVINGERGYGAVVVGSREPHALTLESGWVVLLEPQSDPGRQAQRLQCGQGWSSLPALSDYKPQGAATDAQLLQPIWQVLGLSGWPDSGPVVRDLRLQRLLQRLDEAFSEGGIDPEAWRAARVAQSLSLSTSRFLHVFRAQVGMAWRPYLRWRRLLCAVQALRQGRSATHAALAAGFADSAHLSRTFRGTFGMSVREALASYR